MKQEPGKARGERIKGIGGGIDLKQGEGEEARNHFLSNKRETLKMRID